MRNQACFVLAMFLFLVGARGVNAADLHGTLGYLPVISEDNNKGILVNFLKAMQRAYPEGKISFEVLPFKRSLEGAINGKVDFHAPILKDPNKTPQELGFRYSDANVWNVIFALYTNRQNKEINIDNLSKYRIETDAAHVGFFGFPTIPSSCIDCSLKKVNAGRIDGYIFAAMESDSVVKRLGLKNVRSVPFRTYEGKFVIPLGKHGAEVNRLLTLIVNRTKQNGDYEKTIGIITRYYKNWRPIP